jgi:hypothetical protein
MMMRRRMKMTRLRIKMARRKVEMTAGRAKMGRGVGEETVELPVLLSSEHKPQRVPDTTTLQRRFARRSL